MRAGCACSICSSCMSYQSWENGTQRETLSACRASRTVAGSQTTASRCVSFTLSPIDPQLTLVAVCNPPTLLPPTSRNRRPLLPPRTTARPRSRQSRQGSRAGARPPTREGQGTSTSHLSSILVPSLLLSWVVTGEDQVRPPRAPSHRRTPSDWLRSLANLAIDLPRSTRSLHLLRPRSYKRQRRDRLPPTPIRDGPDSTPQRRLWAVCAFDVVEARRCCQEGEGREGGEGDAGGCAGEDWGDGADGDEGDELVSRGCFDVRREAHVSASMDPVRGLVGWTACSSGRRLKGRR